MKTFIALLNCFLFASACGVIQQSDAGKKPEPSKKETRQKDYSKYSDIYDLVRSEFYTLRVNGSSILNSKTNSINLSGEVLLVVNDTVTTDISHIRPIEVATIEFFDDYRASAYGMRGANGVLKITLKTFQR